MLGCSDGRRSCNWTVGCLYGMRGIRWSVRKKGVRGVRRRVVEVTRMIKYAREAGIVMHEAANLATGGAIRLR